LELEKKASLLLQLTAVVVISVAASYAFQRTQIAYQINGLSISLYIAYGVTIIFGYICFSPYKKSVALVFSLALSAVAFSPISSDTLQFFPLLIPILACLMGVTTILVVPSSRGKGFFGYVLVLALPAVLSESRIGGTTPLLSTIESIGYHELSALSVIIVGGCFYLRCANLANLSRLEFLSKGGDEKEVAAVDGWCSRITLLIIVSASIIAAAAMFTVPLVTSALQAANLSAPFYVVALAMGAGIAVIAGLYVLQCRYQA